MARNYRCPRPVNRLVMLRQKGLHGPFVQPVGGSICVKGVGNFLGPGMPGSGVSATSAFAPDETSIVVNFSACVNVTGPTGIEYQINGGAWTQVTSVTKVSDTQYDFTITSPTIEPGDVVQWRYVGGSGTILDCAEAEDIGNQQIPVVNQNLPPGIFFLLESDTGAGTDIFLLEDDSDGSVGFLLEDWNT